MDGPWGVARGSPSPHLGVDPQSTPRATQAMPTQAWTLRGPTQAWTAGRRSLSPALICNRAEVRGPRQDAW